MVRGIFVHFDIGFREPADRILIGREKRTVGAKHAAGVVLVDAGLRVGDLGEVELLLDRIGPGIEMSGKIGVATVDRLADKIERDGFPSHVRFRIDAGFGQRHLERDLRRGADPVCRDRLALHTGNVFDAAKLSMQASAGNRHASQQTASHRSPARAA